MNHFAESAGAAMLCAILSCPGASAADHKVWMQGTGGQMMQFEPEFLRIAVGDTVTFMPEAAGHSVESLAGPPGAEPWVGSLDHELTVTFSLEGLHAYKCPPHLESGMVGLIQVGDSTIGLESVDSAELPKKAQARLKNLLVKAGITQPD
ncbi:MAG: plastocyanin/azurin family copper-binding protein [Hyphomicrobiales bacterium]